MYNIIYKGIVTIYIIYIIYNIIYIIYIYIIYNISIFMYNIYNIIWKFSKKLVNIFHVASWVKRAVATDVCSRRRTIERLSLSIDQS